MKITIKEIAEEVGVSVTTVSNVINNKEHRVSEKTRNKILNTINKYDYSPNMNARSLVQSSSRLIGLLYYSEEAPVDFSISFVSEILEGVERKVKESGYFVLIHHVDGIEEILKVKNNWRFDGFIGVGFTSSMFEEIRDRISEPIVFIDTHLEETLYSNVSDLKNNIIINTDDYLVGKQATKYLIGKGHKKIAFLSYEFDPILPRVIQQRELGYEAALSENDIIFKNGYLYTDNDFDCLLKDIDKYTAVFVSADELALRFIHFLKKEGILLPDQLSIIGVDDIKYAAYTMPALTTVRLEQIEKGRLAAESLINIISKKEYEPLIFLKSELIERESVRKIN